MATTTSPTARAVGAGVVMVNGPEDEVTDWLSIDWQRVEDDVGRLRRRIFTATRDGDLKKVRNLQKLMLRSRANAVLSVRRVAEVNAGRATAQRRRAHTGASASPPAIRACLRRMRG